MNLYAWKQATQGTVVYTLSSTPTAGDLLYKNNGVPYEYEELTYVYYGADGYVSNVIDSIVDNSIKVSCRYTVMGGGTTLITFGRDTEDDTTIPDPEILISKLKHGNTVYTIKDAQARADSVSEEITISTASVTIAEIAANKNYVLSNASITDITFTACQKSYKETTIEFSTGSTAPTLTDNSGITWVDGAVPVLKANKHYLILIFNKLGFIREY